MGVLWENVIGAIKSGQDRENKVLEKLGKKKESIMGRQRVRFVVQWC